MQATLNPHLEVYLGIDYDLLESTRCLCTGQKEIGQTVCPSCWSRLSASDEVTIAMLRPGDGVAGIVQGIFQRVNQKGRRGW